MKPGDYLPIEKEWSIQLSPNDKTFTVINKVSTLN